MREQIKIKEPFYEKQDFKYRKYLNVKSNTCTKQRTHLKLIMMNTGSSHSLEKHLIENETMTNPDSALDQIKKVIINFGMDYERVIILSDFRWVKNYPSFYESKKLEKRGIKIFIFDRDRESNFENMFIQGVPVICARVINYNLKELILNVLKKLRKKMIFGYKKPHTDWGHYHLLSPNHYIQQLWVDKVVQIVN